MRTHIISLRWRRLVSMSWLVSLVSPVVGVAASHDPPKLAAASMWPSCWCMVSRGKIACLALLWLPSHRPRCEMVLGCVAMAGIRAWMR